MSDDRSIAIERIRHMLEAADVIAGYVARGREAYDADPAIRDAILYQIIVMGEAAKAVVKRDPPLAAELVSIEWSLLARMRDRVTHQYWATDGGIVWETAADDIPLVRTSLLSAMTSIW